MNKLTNIALATVAVATLAQAALAAPLQEASARASATDPTAQASSTDPLVPATASQAGSFNSGSGTANATSSFGQLSVAATLDSTFTQVADPKNAIAQSQWVDGFTLSTPGVSSAILLVDISFAAAFTMSIDPDPLYPGRTIRFQGSLFTCDAGGSSCVVTELVSHGISFSNTGTFSTGTTRISNGVSTVQSFPGQLIPNINVQALAAIRVDNDMPFELQANARCEILTGGRSRGTCSAPDGFRWGGIVGVTDLGGNALTNWRLSSLSGLNYGSGLPLVPGVAQGPDFRPPVGGVPEPASWAMLIAGFGLVGAMQRRRTAIRA